MLIDYIGQNPLHPDGGVESRGRSPGKQLASLSGLNRFPSLTMYCFLSASV
jgi:hypothetical protein